MTHRLAAVLAGLLLPLTALAQPSTIVVTGSVLDADTGRPLEGAHVFIASSLIGTATNALGDFSLPNVPEGAHRIYVSMVGYAPASRDSLFRVAQPYDIAVHLERKVIEMEEVVVNARQARRWQRQLIKFRRLFVGQTPNSAQTTITNPEVLSFTSKWGNLTATASSPLILENRALGYRVQYFLKEFFHYGQTIKYDGEPLFTALEPSDQEEADRWEVNRRKAFLGSLRHYLLALLAERSEQEGFLSYRQRSLQSRASEARFGVDPTQLMRDGPTPLERELTFRGFLEIVYTQEEEDEAFFLWQRQSSGRRPGDQRSYMELNDGPTLVDQSGEVIDPYGVTVYGYFAFERIADQAPKEYRPAEWVTY